MDMVIDTGWRNPFQVTGVLGGDEYIIDDANHALNIKDQCFMEPEDYDPLIANPRKWIWETFLPRKFKYLRDKSNSPKFREFLGAFGDFGAYMGKISAITGEEYGMCSFFPQDTAFAPLGHGMELLFCAFRGIKGFSIDMRRIPEKVEAAIEALNEVILYPGIERAKAKYGKGVSPVHCVDVYPVIFAHTVMNRKQFERIYWPYWKMVADYVEEFDKVGFCYAEGDSTQFHDFYRELPANRFAVLFDLDDIFLAKKNLPNLTIAGGIRASMLGRATPQECVDEVKRVMDAVAYDRKFVFASHTMLSFPGDCNPENLKAVCDYIDEFRY